MPSKTGKQARFMRAVAHGWKPSRMKNPPSRKVAKEFMEEDMREQRYQLGGLAQAQLPRRAGGFPGGGRGIPPQVMQMMLARKQMAPPGGGGLVQPGGPSGLVPGGQGEFISETPGGPNLQGYLQRLRAQRGRGNRIGSGDQQGALARAVQTQTGRPPISRRMGFPGRAR